MTDQEKTDGRLHALEAGERPWRWPVVAAFLFSLLSTLLAVNLILMNTHRQEQHQRDVNCALIIALDDTAHDVPPSTPLGRANALTYANLRVSQGCPPRKGE